MANNELLARAEASNTPWLPPTPGLYTAAYETPTTGNAAITATGNGAITDFTPQGNASIAQPQQIPTLTSDQTAMLFANLGQQDMAAFAGALPASDQQTLAAALSQPTISLQSLSQAFSQIPQGDIQTALAALPPQDLQTVLSALANAAPQTDGTTPGGAPAAFVAPGDTAAATATNPQLTPAQMALVFAQLPAQDMTTMFSALPAADQALLNPALTNPNVTLDGLAQAFSQVPQADLLAAFSQVPASDLQTAITAASNAQQPTDASAASNASPVVQTADAGNGVVQPTDANLPVPQAGPAAGNDMSRQLANLNPDQITKLLGALPQQDSNAFMQALPAGDQQALQAAVQGQTVTDQLLSSALAQLPQQDVITALGQVPTADLQTALQEVTQVNAAANNATTDAPSTNGTDAPTGQSSSNNNWVKWGAASLVAGGGGYYAYKKFDLGTKLAGLKDSMPGSFSDWASKLHLPKFGGAAADVVKPVVATDAAVDLTGKGVAEAAAGKLTTEVPGALAVAAEETIGGGVEKVVADTAGKELATVTADAGTELAVKVIADAGDVAKL